ncbi:MAG: hypothetical protein OHK0017_07260 [Patescibacteria group bacterium]
MSEFRTIKNLVITGPSGSGKSSIIKEIEGVLNRCKRVPTDTTRPVRSGEAIGDEYNFINEDEFTQNFSNGNYLESADLIQFGSSFYGTPKSVIEQFHSSDDTIHIVTPPIRRTAKLIKESTLHNLWIHLHLDDKIRLERLMKRNGQGNESHRTKSSPINNPTPEADININTGNLDISTIIQIIITLISK